MFLTHWLAQVGRDALYCSCSFALFAFFSLFLILFSKPHLLLALLVWQNARSRDTTPAPQQARSPEPLRVVGPCRDYLVRIAQRYVELPLSLSHTPREGTIDARQAGSLRSTSLHISALKKGGSVIYPDHPRAPCQKKLFVGVAALAGWIDRDEGGGGNPSRRSFASQDDGWDGCLLLSVEANERLVSANKRLVSACAPGLLRLEPSGKNNRTSPQAAADTP